MIITCVQASLHAARRLTAAEGPFGISFDPERPETFFIYAAMTIFANSVSPLPLAGAMCIAGVLMYGPFAGFLINLIFAVCGCVLTLVFTRYYRQSCIDKLPPSAKTTWNSLDEALTKDAYYLPLLLRLTPVMPVFLSNVCISLTSVDAWTYTWTTFVGFIPSGLPFAYTAVVGEQLVNEFPPSDPVLFAVLLLGLIATVLAVWKVGSVAMAELSKAGVGIGGGDGAQAGADESPGTSEARDVKALV